jgi:Rha family phage regulatory protein
MKIVINSVEVALTSKGGQAFATSLDVAKVFGKQHFHILRDIKNMPERALSNFGECFYINENNRKMPMYEMNRDGFSFLVMGFTGEKADNFKLDFIDGFNALEKKAESLTPENFTMKAIASFANNFISLEQDIDGIKTDVKTLQNTSAFTSNDCRLYLDAVNLKVDIIFQAYPNNPKPFLYPQIHNAVKAYYQVGSYKDLPHFKIDEVLAFVRKMAVRVKVAHFNLYSGEYSFNFASFGGAK